MKDVLADTCLESGMKGGKMGGVAYEVQVGAPPLLVHGRAACCRKNGGWETGGDAMAGEMERPVRNE